MDCEPTPGNTTLTCVQYDSPFFPFKFLHIPIYVVNNKFLVLFSVYQCGDLYHEYYGVTLTEDVGKKWVTIYGCQKEKQPYELITTSWLNQIMACCVNSGLFYS